MQTQALMQLSALIITLVVALVGGAFTGKSKILTHTVLIKGISRGKLL